MCNLYIYILIFMYLHTRVCMYIWEIWRTEDVFSQTSYEVHFLIENTEWRNSRQNVDRFVNSQRKGQLLLVLSEENICIKWG